MVDDCSNDNSKNICNEFANKDKRIRVISNAKNIGSSLSRKTGLDISKGRFVQFIDSDDWVEKEMLQNLYTNVITKNYDLIMFDNFIFQNGFEFTIKQDFCSYDKITIIRKIISRKIRAFLFTKCISRELLLCSNFPEYSCSEDYYITIQNIHNAKNIGFLNEPLYHYRINEVSLSNSKERTIKSRIEENFNWKNIIAYLKEKYIDLDVFDPELSNQINNMKTTYFFNNKLRAMKDLFELYPESYFMPKGLFKSLLKRCVPKWVKNILSRLWRNKT